MERCIFCKGTGKYKQPDDKERFDELIDREMDKGYQVNYAMAEKVAYDEVGYTIIDCPYCKEKGTDGEGNQ